MTILIGVIFGSFRNPFSSLKKCCGTLNDCRLSFFLKLGYPPNFLKNLVNADSKSCSVCCSDSELTSLSYLNSDLRETKSFAHSLYRRYFLDST
jgi:hypothetical protein